MAQIAFIQPVAPQPPPPGPPASGEQQPFSPHFDKALADKNDQVKGRESENKASDRTIENGEKPESKNQTASPSAANNGKDSPPAVAAAAEEEVATLEQDVTPASSKTQPEVAKFTALQSSADKSSALYFFPPGTLLVVDRFLNIQPPAFSPGPPSNSGEAQIVTPPLAVSITDGLADSLNFSPAQIRSSRLAVQPPEPPSAGDKLLLQLQQLIDSSHETGIVSITSGDNSRRVFSMPNGIFTALAAGAPSNNREVAVPTPGDVGEADGDGPLFAIPQGLEAPAAKSNQGLASLRHTTEQQYFEAKMVLQKGGENDAAPEDSRQSNEFGQHAATGPGLIEPAGVAAEQTNTFAQPLVLVQERQPLPTSESTRPLTLPSAAIVDQDEVFQQFIERFQMTRRALDTQINIKLHPAELGEVNINLFVKEGAIRANVVAQSQHVQEIIEKNMGRLRTVLEQQGFTIEEITVTAKSDAVGDFNLFDRQLFSQNDYNPPSSKSSRTPGALFTLEDPGTDEQAAAAGVNVKI